MTIEKEEKIKLPRELYEKLDLDGSEEVEVVDTAKDSFTVRALNNKRGRDYAPRWFFLPTVISTVVFVIIVCLLHPHVIPLSGSNQSIATGMLIISNIAAFITFVLAYLARRHELYRSVSRKIYWRTFPVIIISYVIIASLGIVALFWFVDQIFHGVQFDRLTSIMIFALLTAIWNYFVIFLVDTFNITMLVNMLILVMSGGLITSMATNGNQYWWQRNFSLLGTSQSRANWQFNLTLVVSAALFASLIDYIFVSLQEKFGRNWRHTVLRVLLTLSAICIAGVGLIPNNGEGLAHFWHDQISMFIVYFMALAILGIRWFLPQAGKSFVRLSYGVVGVMVIIYVLWHFVHYLSLTAFEIFSFALSFAWLMLFINTLMGLLWDDRKIYKVEIKASDE